jgi:tetratricopeptide (TPR) repeat protein
MQFNKFDEAINTYKRFLMKDSINYVYLDKIAYASLKKGDYKYSTELYNKSLSINKKDLIAIKNLAYLYTNVMESDTAIQLLTRGIEIDSTDMDLYLSRAQLYYSKKYTKKALDDYMVILSSGDSSKLYLKRIGIGYCNNLQPKEAVYYLLKAYKIDSSDYETCSYLGQSYYKLKDMNNSIYYYNKVIKILTPANAQLGYAYTLCGDAQNSNGMYKDAIATYLKAQAISSNPNTYMIIANLYDEKLNDRKNAIYYYQKYLDNLEAIKMIVPPEYVGTIKKRLEFLKNNPAK